VREQGGREHLADPGHERSNSSRSRQIGVSRTKAASSFVEPGEPLFQPPDVLINAFVDHLGRVGPAVLFRRSISTNWRRRVTKSFERLACASGSARTWGLTAAPKRTSTCASSASVLASCPVARAKLRTWRG